MKKMTTQKRKKIATRLTFRIFIVLFLVFSVMITVIILNIKSDLTTRELKKLELLATQNASIAAEFMENPLYQEEVIISAIQSMQNINRQDRVDYLSALLTRTKANQPDILSLFYIAEPNQFLLDTPNGFSIFATSEGTDITYDQFTHADETLYTQAKETKNLVIVDPFKKTIDGKEYMVMTVLLPIMDQDKNIVGMVGSNIDTELLNQIDYDNGGYKSFNNQIICGHQTIIINSSDPGSIGKKYIDVSQSTSPERILDSANAATSLTFLDTIKDGSKQYRAFIPFRIGTSSVAWLSGTSISKQEFDAQIMKQIILMAVISIIGLAVLVVFCYYSVKKMLHPIGELDQASRQTAKGNLRVTVHHTSNDELGSLSESFNESYKTLSFYISDIDHIMETMSSGNFNAKPSRPFIGDFKGIETSIENFTRHISSTLSGINDASNHVAQGSEMVSNSASILSQGAAEQAGSIEQLTATINTISEQISKNALQADKASRDASETGEQLEKSNEQMQALIQAIEEISHSSNEISKINKTIQDIAFQTNILALNASVEAARAGVAGKGFAVVADEVRSLASKSADAAENTTELIENSIRSVNNGVKIAAEAAGSLEKGVIKAKSVVKSMDDISRACSSQAEAIGQITQGTDQISSVIQTNSATAEQSAAASQELSEQSRVLKQMIGSFQLYGSTEKQGQSDDFPNPSSRSSLSSYSLPDTLKY